MEKEKERIGIAVIGCGRVGKTHIQSIKKLENIAFLAAVVDVNRNLVQETAHRYNTKFYTNTNEAFNDPAIDAVVICLPHDAHTPVALQALEKGKHVLVEKPFALSVKDAEVMIQTARRKNLILMSGQSYRFFKASQEAKKRVKEEIGEPFNMLYTMAVYFDKNKAPSWWKFEEKTGGLIFPMLGSHSVDFILWIFEGKIPERVYAEAGSFNPDFEGPDEATIIIRFKDGAMATNYLSLNTKQSKVEGLIAGPKGTIWFTYGDTSTGLVGTASMDLYIRGELIMSGVQEPHNIILEEKNFIESIQEKVEPLVKLEEVILQLKVLEAAKKSALTKAPVRI